VLKMDMFAASTQIDASLNFRRAGPWTKPHATETQIQYIARGAINFVRDAMHISHLHARADLPALAREFQQPYIDLTKTDPFYLFMATAAKLHKPTQTFASVPANDDDDKSSIRRLLNLEIGDALPPVHRAMASLGQSFLKNWFGASEEVGSKPHYPVTDDKGLQRAMGRLYWRAKYSRSFQIPLPDQYDVCVELIQSAHRVTAQFVDPKTETGLMAPFVLADGIKVRAETAAMDPFAAAQFKRKIANAGTDAFLKLMKKIDGWDRLPAFSNLSRIRNLPSLG
jgi:hypothetical protein